MMACAVFKDDEKLSRTIPTKEETLEEADEAGLVDTVKDKPILQDNLGNQAVRTRSRTQG